MEITDKFKDEVLNPRHYCDDPSGVECIQITRHRDFNIGNAIKYLWRHGLKYHNAETMVEDEIKDLNKAIYYIKDEIERLGGVCLYEPINKDKE